MTHQIKLVVGLGNPGRQYVRTRHNVGFWCVQRLAKENSIAVSKRHRHAVTGEGTIEGRPVALAKPRTFVNDSGRAVVFLLDRYKASPADLVVVYDEMNLEPGKLRVRTGGSSGGHNGMKSIIAAIGSQEFARVRIGVGRPSDGLDEIDYVLGTLPREEKKQVDEAVERASQAIVSVLTEGIDAAMNRFN